MLGVGRLKVGASTLFYCYYTITVGRYHYKHRRGLLYSRIQINNIIACIKNQVLPSIIACYNKNYIGDLSMLNSLYFVPYYSVCSVYSRQSIQSKGSNIILLVTLFFISSWRRVVSVNPRVAVKVRLSLWSRLLVTCLGRDRLYHS